MYIDIGTKKITLKLLGKNIGEYSIVFAGDPSEPEKFAADELVGYIEKLTGEKLSVSGNTSSKIILGSADPEKYGDEGFRIFTADGDLHIEGSPLRGTLYGVYTFLEEKLGIRFLTDECTVFPGEDTEISDFDTGVISPVFEWRDTYFPCYWKTGIAVRRKVNSCEQRSIPGHMGGTYLYSGRFVHTMESLLGVPQTDQPCFSDEDNLKKCIEGVRAILRDHPDTRIVSVTQNDNNVYCTCEKCRRIDEQEGSHSGSLLRFVNAVADDIKDDYPKASIMTLAYLHTKKPPKITRPRENVIIEYAPMESCYVHHLTDEVCSFNRELMRDFEEWAKITNRIYIWDYCADFSFSAPMFPDFHVLRGNMRYYAENHVRGMFCEGDNYRAEGSTELPELRAYLISKLIWEPYMSEEDYRKHMLDFVTGYYGDSGRFIVDFIDLATEAVVDDHHHFDCYCNPIFLYKPTKLIPLLPKMKECWDKVVAGADSDEHLARIRKAKLQFDFLYVFHLFDGVMKYGTEAEKADMLKRSREFYEDISKIGFQPRGALSELPKLDDLAVNTAVKIYWN